jgi:hypothetical protein
MRLDEDNALWSYWLQWITANLLAYAIGFPLCAFPLGMMAEYNPGFEFIFPFVLGGITGLAQWSVIHWRIRRMGSWVLVTAIGWGLGLLTITDLPSEMKGKAYFGWVLIGILLGLAQWLVLKGKVMRSEWWIIANIVAWVVGGYLGNRVTTVVNGSSFPVSSTATLIGISTTVAIVESLRGVVLVWLLRQPILKETALES